MTEEFNKKLDLHMFRDGGGNAPIYESIGTANVNNYCEIPIIESDWIPENKIVLSDGTLEGTVVMNIDSDN